MTSKSHPFFSAFLGVLGILAVSLSFSPTRAQDDIDSLLANMTLEQKVGQMFLASLYGTQMTEVGRDFLQQYQPGGVVIFEYNVPAENAPEAVTTLINTFQQTTIDAGGVPLIIAADQEGGIIATFEEGDGFTAFPVPYLVAATGDADLAYRYGQSIAEELLALGVTMNFAPVADLETNIYNPIIRRRAFGNDPQIVGAAVANVVRGMQDAGVMSVVKHFPGHGDTTQDSHTVLPIVSLEHDALESREFIPFVQAMDANVSGVMVAHIWFSALEPQANTPATLSVNIVDGLLRDEMGYEGLAITDAMDMDAIDMRYSSGEASVLAIQAGIDLIALGPHMSLEGQAEAIRSVVEAVQSGTISEERIEASVRRILSAKQRYDILDWQPLEPSTARERLNLDAHAEFVDELFRAGVTLAFDNPDLVPLTGNVTVIYPGTRPQIERQCRTRNETANWITVSASPTADEISSAQTAASYTDVTVVFTDDALYDNTQQALVNALSPERTVVVALASPYDVMTFPNIGAYLLTYSPLPQGIPVVCDVLFGVTEAQGILPMSLVVNSR
jgi:beta-N-acetylhexosaminidase